MLDRGVDYKYEGDEHDGDVDRSREPKDRVVPNAFLEVKHKGKPMLLVRDFLELAQFVVLVVARYV